jgi:hypothetical protein
VEGAPWQVGTNGLKLGSRRTRNPGPDPCWLRRLGRAHRIRRAGHDVSGQARGRNRGRSDQCPGITTPRNAPCRTRSHRTTTARTSPRPVPLGTTTAERGVDRHPAAPGDIRRRSATANQPQIRGLPGQGAGQHSWPGQRRDLPLDLSTATWRVGGRRGPGLWTGAHRERFCQDVRSSMTERTSPLDETREPLCRPARPSCVADLDRVLESAFRISVMAVNGGHTRGGGGQQTLRLSDERFAGEGTRTGVEVVKVAETKNGGGRRTGRRGRIRSMIGISTGISSGMFGVYRV